ncbi:MAG: alpha/beta fold hydrolase [Planctomycetaceae bacterium]|nr:alpha/beta fold hydrolase [Planctomycetaceae bacterium]
MTGINSSSISSESTEVQRRSLADSAPLILPSEHPPGVAPFVPARGIRGGHLQTLCSAFFPGNPRIQGTVQRKLRLPDDDFLVLHDDAPPGWRRGDHVVLMMHGLGGSHQSGYMARIAAKLHDRKIRTFRMDHRGCGAGAGLAKRPYHAGRIEDLHAAIGMVERLCPGSLISLAGFSLSGNLLLRYLGDSVDRVPLSVFRAVAVCPPIDLQRCMIALGQSPRGQRYDYYFAQKMVSHIAAGPMWQEHLPLAQVRRPPRRLYELDSLFTAPASGYQSAEHYYECASATAVISKIRVHTTILGSQDDPVIDVGIFSGLKLPPNVTMCLTAHGGHMGYIGRTGCDPDRRWMDWRVVEWLLDA